jgi:outer membrane protein assembly factor BamB
LPFFPLRGVWSSDLGLAPSGGAATTAMSLIVPFSNGTIQFFDITSSSRQFSVPFQTSLPLVVDGRYVFATTDDSVTAFDAGDASAKWTAPLPGPPAFAPVAAGGWAFVALKNGSIVALRTDSGKAVWTVTPGGAVGIPLAIEGDRFYAATGAIVQALAVQDGQPLWKATLDADVTAVAAVEGHVFAATAGRWLVALDARKGEVRWRYRIGGAAIGLAVDEDRVIAVMLDQSVRAFKIGSGAQAWRQELSFRPTTGPIVAGRGVLVAGFAPAVRVLDRRTGANAGLYSVPIPAAGAIPLETLSALAVVRGAGPFDDGVAFVTQHGLMHVARRTFDELDSPITAWPGTAVAPPQPPPGWVEPPPAPADAKPADAKPEETKPAPSPAPPAGTPPSTPPKPPAR